MYQNPSAFLLKNCNLDEGEDDDVMHVDDLEKARVQQAKEAAELEKAKEEASNKEE